MQTFYFKRFNRRTMIASGYKDFLEVSINNKADTFASAFCISMFVKMYFVKVYIFL